MMVRLLTVVVLTVFVQVSFAEQCVNQLQDVASLLQQDEFPNRWIESSKTDDGLPMTIVFEGRQGAIQATFIKAEKIWIQGRATFCRTGKKLLIKLNDYQVTKDAHWALRLGLGGGGEQSLLVQRIPRSDEIKVSLQGLTLQLAPKK